MRPPKPAAKPSKPMTMKQALMPPPAVPAPKPKFNPIANLGHHAIPPKGSAPADKMKALTPAQVAHVKMIVQSMKTPKK